MHPELLSSLVAERRRDLNAAMTGRRDLNAAMTGRRAPGARPAGRVPALTWPALLPRFRVSWTHTTLAAVSGRRRGRSVVIVISATRTH